MGCLISLVKMFYSFLEIIFVLGAIIIAAIIKLIKELFKIYKENKRKKQQSYIYQTKTTPYKNNYNQQTYNNNISNNNNNQNNKTNYSNTNKNKMVNKIPSDESYLKIYISKNYKGMRKNNELNYDLINIETYNAPYVYYDEFADVKGYNAFESYECSSVKYGYLLQKVYEYCKDGFYATIGYGEYDIKYEFKIKNQEVYLNNQSKLDLSDHYLSLKTKINNFADNLNEYFTYIKDENFYNYVVPNDDLDCDYIAELSDKLKETYEVQIFEIPYMEEISMIIDVIEPKIIKEYEKDLKETLDSLPDIEVIEPSIEEPLFKKNKNNHQEKELSWEEKKFEEEADLWGLSEEDRRIAKQERMTPAEFVEAEEYDDDELLLDEWER